MKDTFGFAAHAPLFGREGMIDLVKALRNRATWETATGITEPSEHIDWMAADEITSLRGQVEALDNERNRLWADKLKMQGEITRLRDALRAAIAKARGETGENAG